MESRGPASSWCIKVSTKLLTIPPAAASSKAFAWRANRGGGAGRSLQHSLHPQQALSPREGLGRFQGMAVLGTAASPREGAAVSSPRGTQWEKVLCA